MRVSLRRLLPIAALIIGATSASAEATGGGEPIRGVVKPAQESWLSTEISARLLRLTRKEGESFKKGELLAVFDCDKYLTELRAAEAERELNLLVLDNSKELDRRQAIGRFEVDQNRAKYDKAKAQAESMVVRTKECNIVAPFTGKVAEVKGREFEISTPGQPLLRIVSSENPEIEMIVPSLWLRWIKTGFQFRVTIDETGTEHTAEVERISAAVDSVSQTVKIMSKFNTKNPAILPGMSLNALITPPTSE